MAKTAKQVQGDVYALLRESPLAASLTGGIYRAGFRPRDSRLEDAVVTFTSGQAGQVQEGVVTVNIYVPDIDPYGNGVLVEDGERTAELEHLAQAWADDLAERVNTYDFALRDTIHTDEEPGTHQHFVVVRLGYRLCDL